MNKFQELVTAFLLTTSGKWGVTKSDEPGSMESFNVWSNETDDEFSESIVFFDNGFSLDEHNANFIAIAHNTVPELMAELTRLQSFEAEVNSQKVHQEANFQESVNLLRDYGLQALDTLVMTLRKTSDQAHFQFRADKVREFLSKIMLRQDVVEGNSTKSELDYAVKTELQELRTAHENTIQGYWVVDDHGRFILDTSTPYSHEVVESMNFCSVFSDQECIDTLVFITHAHNKMSLVFKELDRLYEIETELNIVSEELFLMKNESSNGKNSL
jgi:hypothetical protein